MQKTTSDSLNHQNMAEEVFILSESNSKTIHMFLSDCISFTPGKGLMKLVKFQFMIIRVSTATIYSPILPPAAFEFF